MTTNALTSSPKLSFLPTEVLPGGTQVFEVQLAPHGIPLAPFKASYFTVEPDGVSPVDSHSVHEMWMVAQGQGELIYDGQTCIISPRQTLYFEPPKPHQVKNCGPEPLVIFSVWWK
jgi:mannose-6-phosphate isomerase-like protein (cupin superfamily)